MKGPPYRLGLAARLSLSFGLPTLLVFFLLGLLADHTAKAALESQLDARLISVAHAERAMLSGYFTELLGRVDGDDLRSLESLRKRIQPIAEETGVRRVYLFNTELDAIVDTHSDVVFGDHYYEIEADLAEIEASYSGIGQASVLYTGPDGTPYKTAYLPIFNEAEEVIAVIAVEGSTRQADELSALRGELALLGAAGVILLLFTSFGLSRRLRRRVYRLASSAERIGGGDLSGEVQCSQNDELGDLEAAIDTMRRALQAREEEMQLMLSGIAHEVRNPLGGMELFLGLLDEDLAAEMKDQDGRREHVAKLKRELTYLNRIVQEFLSFARRTQLDLKRFDACDLVDEIGELMGADLLNAQVKLELSCPKGAELTADRDRLKQVLVNLLRNAWQASSPGDRIWLELKELSDQREICVRDEGAGIAPEKLGDILRPFFTTREKGTGLGLPLAQKIVNAHGGAFDIESTAGEGTKVTLTFPFDDELLVQSKEIPEGWLG